MVTAVLKNEVGDFVLPDAKLIIKNNKKQNQNDPSCKKKYTMIGLYKLKTINALFRNTYCIQKAKL